jgi:hypothetical protein
MKLKYSILLYVSTFIIICGGCKKNEGPDLHLAIPTPVNVKIDSLRPEKAIVRWQYSDKRVQQFTVEVSPNSAFSTIARSYTVKDTARQVHVDSLGSLTQYYVRVRALSDDVLYYSGYGAADFISEEIENIFQAVLTADLTFTTALLKWSVPKKGTVNKIIIIPVGGTALPAIVLGASDITARQITVTGLKAATDYRAEIYEDGDRKGIATFTTRDPNSVITINNGTVIYDLLNDAITAANSGDVINIGGAKYNFTASGTINIQNKSLTFKAVAGTVVPEITSGAFNLSGNVASLKIIGIKFIITSGNYFIAATGATGTTNISLEGLDVTGPAAGLVYLATGSTASLTFNVDNCLIHDFGAVGGDFIDFRAGEMKGMTIKNTSIWNVARDFLRTDATATISGTLSFANCTINNFCIITSGSTNRFVYLRANNSVVTVNKCIVSNKVGTTNSGISGTGTSVTFTDSNVFGSSASAITSSPTVKTNLTNLDAQYANAAQGDFTVGNATVKAAAQGDPRWLK